MKRHLLAKFCMGIIFFLPMLLHGEVLLDYTTGKPVRYAGNFSSAPVVLGKYQPKNREFRGVWVATVENLDFKTCRSADEFRKNYRKIINNLVRAKFNAIIFQIRPCNDAFYPSKHNPWSSFLTGREDVGIKGFDPLRFMIDEAHRRGIEFHAWFNPYRVTNHTPLSKNAFLRKLSPKNFARRNPGLVLSIPLASKQNQLILNPGEPVVMQHIVVTVNEVVKKYPIDAVHFDDYFYPYSGLTNQDIHTYRRYGKGMTIANWRRRNVTRIIYSIKKLLDEHQRKTGRVVRFGISPFGIWANRSSLKSGSLTGGLQSYFVQHADTRLWVKAGYLDYIVPQIYWEFSHKTAAYAALVDWWCNVIRGTRTRLFIGHAASRLGSSRKWGAPELINQLRYNCSRREVSGSVFFSYRHMFLPSSRVQRTGVNMVLRAYAQKTAITPWKKH